MCPTCPSMQDELDHDATAITPVQRGRAMRVGGGGAKGVGGGDGVW